MFGTEMLLSTFLIISVEMFLLSFLFFHYLTYRKDLSRLRFLILTACFINYNVWSGLFPNYNITVNILVQSVFEFGSGIILACYYYYYLVVELRVSQGKYFNVKNLIFILFTLFFVFVLGYMFFGNVVLSKQMFFLTALLVSALFCIRTIKLLIDLKSENGEDNTPYQTMLMSGYIGIVFMASMPLNGFYEDFQIIDIGLINVSFVFAFFAYFRYQAYLDGLRHELIGSVGSEKYKEKARLKSSYNLSERELEVADLILKDLRFFVISQQLNITEKTVSKHASNIYRKTDTHNKFEFIQKYG